MNAKNVAVIGKNAYYRSHAVGGKRYGSDEEYIQLCAPGKDASFDSSLAIILLENAADAFEQANLDSETSGNRDSYNLRELANVYVELGGILVEEQMWLTAAPVYEKLLDTYRRIYSHNMDPTNQRELIADRHVLALLDEDTEGTQLNPLLHRGSTVASSDLVMLI